MAIDEWASRNEEAAETARVARANHRIGSSTTTTRQKVSRPYLAPWRPSARCLPRLRMSRYVNVSSGTAAKGKTSSPAAAAADSPAKSRPPAASEMDSPGSPAASRSSPPLLLVVVPFPTSSRSRSLSCWSLPPPFPRQTTAGVAGCIAAASHRTARGRRRGRFTHLSVRWCTSRWSNQVAGALGRKKGGRREGGVLPVAMAEREK